MQSFLQLCKYIIFGIFGGPSVLWVEQDQSCIGFELERQGFTSICHRLRATEVATKLRPTASHSDFATYLKQEKAFTKKSPTVREIVGAERSSRVIAKSNLRSSVARTWQSKAQNPAYTTYYIFKNHLNAIQLKCQVRFMAGTSVTFTTLLWCKMETNVASFPTKVWLMTH